MKKFKILLFFSLIFTQSILSKTDKEYDILILKEQTLLNKQVWKCNKAVMNHGYNSKPEVCLKVIQLAKKSGFKTDKFANIYI